MTNSTTQTAISSANYQRFTERTILITGAGTGMGEAAALRLAKEGANVVLLGRRQEPLNEVATKINHLGGKAVAMPCDITTEAEVIACVEKATEMFGPLHGLFANAGILGEFTPLADVNTRLFDTLMETNVKGTFLTIKACLPHLAEGSIVINASWTATSVMPGAGAYASTKGALLSMMNTLAIEQGARGLRVNAISPGIILTPMAEEVLDAEFATKLANQAALKRNGTPDDVSGAVAWLLSDDSAFVTGQNITIDGGFTVGGVRL